MQQCMLPGSRAPFREPACHDCSRRPASPLMCCCVPPASIAGCASALAPSRLPRAARPSPRTSCTPARGRPSARRCWQRPGRPACWCLCRARRQTTRRPTRLPAPPSRRCERKGSGAAACPMCCLCICVRKISGNTLPIHVGRTCTCVGINASQLLVAVWRMRASGRPPTSLCSMHLCFCIERACIV